MMGSVPTMRTDFARGLRAYRGSEPEAGRDFDAAIRWFGRGAGKGCRFSQFALAMMHALGHGVEPDPEAAEALFGQLAARGSDRGRRASESLRSTGRLPDDLRHEWLVLHRFIVYADAPF